MPGAQHPHHQQFAPQHPAQPLTAAPMTSSGGKPSVPTWAIIAGAVVALLVIGLVAFALLGGEPKSNAASGGSTPESAQPLDKVAYTEEVTKIFNGKVWSTSSSDPAKVKQDIVKARAEITKLGTLVPPTEVAAEHAVIVSSFTRMLDDLTIIANADPTDPAAAKTMEKAYARMTKDLATVETAADSIDKKLGAK